MKYECIKCDNDMEEVEFSDGHAKPEGMQGLLCPFCGWSVSGDEDLYDYLFNS